MTFELDDNINWWDFLPEHCRARIDAAMVSLGPDGNMHDLQLILSDDDQRELFKAITGDEPKF